MLKRLLRAAVVVSPLCLPSDAEAVLEILAEEVGNDVVFTASGSLTFGDGFSKTNLFPGGGVVPNISFVFVGPPLGSEIEVDDYIANAGSTIVGPERFGDGNTLIRSTSNTGGVMGIEFSLQRVVVPVGYVPGTPLPLSTMTIAGKDFDDLGMDPGTYEWSWDVFEAFPIHGELQIGAGCLLSDDLEITALCHTEPQSDMIRLTVVPEPSAFLYGGLISSIVGCGVWAKRRFV